MKFDELNQDNLGEILDNIKNHQSYFAGGTLCVDDVLENQMILMLSLDGHAFNWTTDQTYPLLKDNFGKLCDVYLETKGETDYYKEKVEKFG